MDNEDLIKRIQHFPTEEEKHILYTLQLDCLLLDRITLKGITERVGNRCTPEEIKLLQQLLIQIDDEIKALREKLK